VRLALPGQQRSEHVDAGAHAADEVVVGLVPDGLGDVDRHGRGVPVVGHRAAEAAQQVGHDLDIEDVRHRAERGFAGCEQGDGHQLQGAVLRARDRDLADQAGTAGDPEPFHGAQGTAATAPIRAARQSLRSAAW